MGQKISQMTPADLPLTGAESLELSVPGATEEDPPLTRQATAQDIRNLPAVVAVTALSIVSGAVDVDASLGEYFTLALTADVTDITFTDVPAACTLMLRITQDSTARTVAWPASFKWAGGTAGAISTGSGAVDLLAITTFDGGTTWRATLAKDFK